MATKELISELQWLKGVGPVRAKALAKEGILTTKDLLLYLPRAYVERSTALSLKDLTAMLKKQDNPADKDKIFADFAFKQEVNVIAEVNAVQEHQFGKKRKLLTLQINDGSGRPAKVNFWNRTSFFKKVYQRGMLLSVNGTPEIDKYNQVSFTHPDIEIIDPEDKEMYSKGGILPLYKLSENMRLSGINSKVLRGIIRTALDEQLSTIVESLPKELTEHYGLPSLKDTVKNLHFPESPAILKKARYRIKYEEFFYYQLLLALQKKAVELDEKAPMINQKSQLARNLYDSLPFELTGDQKKVLNELASDFKKGKPMNRLLQGDVGSGKTIVALLSMCIAVDNGFQCAFMAPTEILAEQHYHTITRFFSGFELKIALITGSQKSKLKQEMTGAAATGMADIIVGTHALFQEGMRYNKLGYVIIDEQHRFGVAQRRDLIDLAKKSFGGNEDISPHILVMTATPIPRTLTMTAYGNLDVSYIRQKPSNRKPILTRVAFENQRDVVYDFIRDQVKEGRQAYIVFPFVEKSENEELQDVKAATEFFDHLQDDIFSEFKCGLLHGQMNWRDKEESMDSFLKKKYDILIATTVIEVGIDVPNASVMLIENAERFGLSQLHQLRGRVGRGGEQSYCILMTKDHYKFQMKKKTDDEEQKSAIIRLRTMQETDDGFKIAEADLKLRGPGDILGTKQSGMPDFKYVDLVNDGEVLAAARKDAHGWVQRDPALYNDNSKILRIGLKNAQQEGAGYFNIA